MRQPSNSSTSVVPATDWTVALSGQLGATAKSHEPASNTAAVVTLAVPGSGISHVLYSVAWSYEWEQAPTWALWQSWQRRNSSTAITLNCTARTRRA